MSETMLEPTNPEMIATFVETATSKPPSFAHGNGGVRALHSLCSAYEVLASC
jgi:hypothetical protein